MYFATQSDRHTKDLHLKATAPTPDIVFLRSDIHKFWINSWLPIVKHNILSCKEIIANMFTLLLLLPRCREGSGLFENPRWSACLRPRLGFASPDLQRRARSRIPDYTRGRCLARFANAYFLHCNDSSLSSQLFVMLVMLAHCLAYFCTMHPFLHFTVPWQS